MVKRQHPGDSSPVGGKCTLEEQNLWCMKDSGGCSPDVAQGQLGHMGTAGGQAALTALRVDFS